jgi:DNA-binding response OmpR family regulator
MSDHVGRDASHRTRVLVIEDDPAYAHLIRLQLEANTYQVLRAADGETGLAALPGFDPDAVILDLVLPDLDGFEICRRIRQDSDVPIIMLTSRGEERNKVQGLMIGADDYVTKPFSAPELLARLTTILRRAGRRGKLSPPVPLQIGNVTIDFAAARVYRAGQPVAITATEYKLLTVLAENAGRVLVADDLLLRVWGPGYDGDTSLLRTTVGRLRHKLGDSPGDGPIHNVRGIGYMFEHRG